MKHSIQSRKSGFFVLLALSLAMLPQAAAQTPPILSTFNGDTLPAGTVKTYEFTAYDAEGETSLAELFGTNPQLITASASVSGIIQSFVFGPHDGAGANLTITPVAGATGTVTVTVTVSDLPSSQTASMTDDQPAAMSTSQTFTLTYTGPNAVPVVANFPTFKVYTQLENRKRTYDLTVSDDNTAASALTFTFTRGNDYVIPVADANGTALTTATYSPTSSRTHLLSVSTREKTDESDPPDGILDDVMGATVVQMRTIDSLGDSSLSTFVQGRYNTTKGRNINNSPFGLWNLDSYDGTAYDFKDNNIEGGLRKIKLRDASIRPAELDSDGYVLRASWKDLEYEAGKYDFTIISNAMAKLGAHQRLSLILVQPEPDYIRNTVLPANQWYDQSPDLSTQITTDVLGQRAVPWAPYLRQQRRNLMAALSAYQVDGIPLKDHPRLAVINPYLAGGHSGVRDPNPNDFGTTDDDLIFDHLAALDGVPNSKGYTRTALGDAVYDEIDAVRQYFPDTTINFGFFEVANDTADPDIDLTTYLRDRVLAATLEGNGFAANSGAPVALFQENLAASRPDGATGDYLGLPQVTVDILNQDGSVDTVPAVGAPLSRAVDTIPISFQALGSWIRPFNVNHAEKNLDGRVSDGIDHGYNTYGARYFEIYTPDFDANEGNAVIHAWHTYLGELSAVSGTNTAPRLGVDSAPLVNANVSWPVKVFVSDAQKLPGTLTVTASTNSPTIIPTVTVGGSGTARTVTLKPAAGTKGQQGVTVTVNVSDGTFTTSKTFPVTIEDNTPPTLASIPAPAVFAPGEARLINITVGDTQTLSTLTITGTSSGTFVAADGTVQQIFPPIGIVPTSGQTGSARTVWIDANKSIPPNTGIYSATITFTVTDGKQADGTVAPGGGLTASRSFTASVDSSLPQQ